jgi:hypothetical protein
MLYTWQEAKRLEDAQLRAVRPEEVHQDDAQRRQ